MQVVSRTGMGGSLRVEEILPDQGGISEVGVNFAGTGYQSHDVIVPSPPSFLLQE